VHHGRHTRCNKTHRGAKAAVGATPIASKCKRCGPNNIASLACLAPHSDYLQVCHNAALHSQKSDVCASKYTSLKGLQDLVVLEIPIVTIEAARDGVSCVGQHQIRT